MWSIILLLGVCPLHLTTGIRIKHDNLIINITEKDGNIKSLMSVETVSGLNNGNIINICAMEIDMIEKGAFSRLTGAKNLNLEYNKLKELDFSLFSNLPNLEGISVAHNHITKLSGILVGSFNLEYLNLSDNNIKNLGESNFDGLPNSLWILMDKYTVFTVPYADREDIPNMVMQVFPWFFHMGISGMHPRSAILGKSQNSEPILVKLCKTDNGTGESVKLVAIEESFGDCLRINASNNSSTLSLARHGLRKFRRGWYQIPETFAVIDVSGNNITEITPELLNDLPEFITSVIFLSNNLTIIKRNVIDNKFLRVLDMGRNHLITIEAGAFEKTNLHLIDFTHNHLRSMDFVRTLPNSLECLILNYNEISEIPSDSLVNLKVLKHLEMKHNQLTHLPVGIFRGLKELQYLHMGGNRLQKIEAGIFDDNERLAVFVTSDNSIKELEDGVFKNAMSIKLIDLEKNEIKKISRKTFSGLHTGYLNMLSLSSNRIDTIEEGSFANMTIDYFKLTGNPLTKKSAAKGAFESSKLGTLRLPTNFHINDMEYTSLVRHHDFYGMKIQYLTRDIHQVIHPIPKTKTHFFVVIRD